MDIFKVNSEGLMVCIYVFMDDLIVVLCVYLVNIVSVLVFIGLFYGSIYVVSKWVVVGFFELLCLEMLECGLK